MSKESLMLDCIEDEDRNTFLEFYKGELLVSDDKDYRKVSKEGLFIRMEFMDIEESETSMIAMEDIPKLIEFLQEQLSIYPKTK